MPTLYVELISRISGYTGPLRQAAASTKAFTADVGRQLQALDDAALGSVRSVSSSLAALDERVIASGKVQRDSLRATVAAWRETGAQIKGELTAIVDANNVASLAQIRAASDTARALRNEAAALPRNDPARQQLYLSARDYEDQARNLQRLRSDAAAARSTIGNLALVTGGVLVAADIAAAVSYAHLQTAMANVATISGALQGKTTMAGRAVSESADHAKVAAANWNTMTNAVVNMSRELPQSAETLTKSLYDIVSSGFDGNDALTILHASAVGASAGLTTTANAAKGLVGVLNAFGLSAAQANDVNDIMFQTVNKGVVTYDELTQGLGQYASMAAQASHATNGTTKNFAEAEAALAAMTLAGIPAVQAATSLNRVYTQLLHPSAALQAAFTKLGFQTGQQAIQTLGLHGVVQALTSAYGDNATAALQLFPEIRAARGYLALTANAGQNYARVVESIVDPTQRAAAAQQALEQQQKTASYQMTLLKNNAVALGIGLGKTLLPPLQFIEKAIGDFEGALNLIPGPIRDIIGIAALAAGSILLLGGAYLKAQLAIEKFQIQMALSAGESSMLPGLMSGAVTGLGYLGAALAVASIAYGIFTARERAASQVASELNTIFNTSTGQLDKMAATSQLTQELVSKGLIDNLQKAGVTVPQAISAIEAGGNRYSDLLSKIRSQESTSGKLFQAFVDPWYKNDPMKAEVGLAAIESGYKKASSAAQDSASAADQNASALTSAGDKMSAYTTATQTAADGTQTLTDAQKALNSQFTSMVDLSSAASSAFTQLQAPSDVFDAIQQAETSTASTASSTTSSYNASLAARSKAIQSHAAQLRVAASVAGKDMKASYQEQARAAENRAKAITASDKAATSSTKQFAQQGVVSLQQWLDGLQKAGAQQKQWDTDLHTIATKGGSPEMIAALQSLGSKGVAVTRQMADETRPQIEKINRDFSTLGPKTTQSLNAWMDALQGQLQQRADYMSNLAKLASRGRLAIVAGIEQITDPKQAAAMAAQAVDATGKQLDRLQRLFRRNNGVMGQDWETALEELNAIAKSKGKETVESLAAQFTGGDVDKMKLELTQLRNQISDLATRHKIDLIIGAEAPTAPVRVPIIAQIAGLNTGHGGTMNIGAPPSNLGDLLTGSGGTSTDPPAKHHHHAQGGIEDHVAQIARPGDWRVWAEPETGGEAYIPLSPSKRRRSVSILDDVADRFGMALLPKMADGGIVSVLLQQLGGIQGISSLAPILTQLIEQATSAGGAGGSVPGAPTSVSGNAKIVQQMAAKKYGWTGAEWDSLYHLLMGESGFRNIAQNPTTTAYGMFQFLDSTWAGYGVRKTSDPTMQTVAGLRYIKSRYGDPIHAYSTWLSRSPHWYADGGINGPRRAGGRALIKAMNKGGVVYGGSTYGSSSSSAATTGGIPSAFSLQYTAGQGALSPTGATTAASKLSLTPYLTPDEVIQDYLAKQSAHGVMHPKPPSLKLFLSDLDQSRTAMANWSSNLRKIAHLTNDDVANALAQMGQDGAQYVNQLANASGPQLKTLTKDMEALSQQTQEAGVNLRDFGSQLTDQVDTSSQLQSAVMRLAGTGYGALARQLEAVGGPDALKLARQALRHPGRARRLNRKARQGAALLTSDDINNATAILSDLDNHRHWGIHDVAGDLGMDEQTLIDLSNKIAPRLRSVHAHRFLNDLSKANHNQPYAEGGYAPPGSGIRWAEAGAGGEWMIPGALRKRGRATALLRSAASRFGYALTPTAAGTAARPVGVSNVSAPTIVINLPAQESGALIGALTVQHQGSASPSEIIGEAFHQAKVANLRRGRPS